MVKILAIIPARSGSKRIKNKNIRLFQNKPLLAHSIIHSLKSKYIQRTIVSTDSPMYANIATRYGAEVPFLRPKNISKDKSTDLQCFTHCLSYFKKKENYVPDLIVHLRPTYPLREKGLIDNCIKRLIKNKNFHSLRTICKSDDPIEKMWFQRRNKSIYNPVTRNNQNHSVSDQSLKQSYHQNSCVDVLRVKHTILKNKIAGSKILGYEMTHNFDIDTVSDLKKFKIKNK